MWQLWQQGALDSASFFARALSRSRPLAVILKLARTRVNSPLEINVRRARPTLSLTDDSFTSKFSLTYLSMAGCDEPVLDFNLTTDVSTRS